MPAWKPQSNLFTKSTMKNPPCDSMTDFCCHSPLYFLRVAIPPRICRSALFRSRSSRTCRYRAGLTFGRRSVRSLWTVDFETPNCLAAARTVALFSIMYTARSRERSSMFVYIYTTPYTCVVHVYEGAGTVMRAEKGRKPFYEYVRYLSAVGKRSFTSCTINYCKNWIYRLKSAAEIRQH